MIINHNLTLMRAESQNKKAAKAENKAAARLQSGIKINRADDDSAGLGISESMRAQIRGLSQAQRNIQDGISLVQIADQGLGQIIDPNLQRMRQLAVQAGDGALTSADRQCIQQEIEQLKRGIDDIAEGTHFNGINLLSPKKIDKISGLAGGGSNPADIVFLIDGTGSMDIAVANLNANIPALASNLADKGVTDVRFGISIYYDNTIDQTVFPSLGSTWTNSVTDITNALSHFRPPASLSQETAMNGVVEVANSYTFRTGGNGKSVGQIIIVSDSGDDVVNDNTTEASALSAVTSQGIIVHGAFNFSSHGPEDAAPISQLVAGTGGQMIDYNTPGWGNALSINVASGIAASVSGKTRDSEQIEQHSLILQVGANQDQNMRIQLVDATTSSLKIDDLKIDPQSFVDKAIRKIDQAIATASKWQSQFGVYHNALDHLASSRQNIETNLTDSESKLRDADMAAELMERTKNSIVEQASNAMMAQAAKQPQQVLQLLQG